MSDERLESEVAGATSRRALLAGAGALGATAVLAACGTDPEDSGRDPFSPAPPAEDPGANGDSSDEGDEDEGDEGNGDGLVEAAEVEVGGGVILPDQGVVITQPAEGEWKAFSATCTHEGCTVSEMRTDTIYCGCHGSAFSIADGSPVAGPAPAPLQERGVVVEDGWVVLT